MKRNYHHARKYRQLKFAVKQLKNNNHSNESVAKLLVLKIKRLISQLKSVMATYRLKRLIAPALLVLSTALQNPVEAQQFEEPVKNPFDIVTSNPILSCPALIDIDADGDLDLLKTGLAYGYSSNFFFQENIGNSTTPVFDKLKANPFGLETSLGTFYPSFGDLDNDGDYDLITGFYYGIAYYENTGTAQKPVFGKSQLNPFGLDLIGIEELPFPELTDLDADGDLDILVNVDGIVAILENTGDSITPEFITPIIDPFELDIDDDNTFFFRTVDIDNDGDLDIVAGSQVYNDYTEVPEGQLAYYENIGTANEPNFELVEAKPLTENNLLLFSIPTIGDLDDDGDLDLLANQFSSPAVYFENEGSAEEFIFNNGVEAAFEIEDFQSDFFVDANNIAVPELVDLDADGDLDLIYGGSNYTSDYFTGDDRTTGHLKFYENVGTDAEPQFGLPTAAPFEKVNTYYTANPSFTDVDNDGDLDLFVADTYGKITFYENTGNPQNPTFESQLENPFGLVFEDYSYSKLVFADMDNDGDEDCFNSLYNTSVYFENTSANGEISFQNRGNFFNIAPIEEFDSETMFQTVTDIDQDGDLDLFLFSEKKPELFYYKNIGNVDNANFAEVDSTSFNFGFPVIRYDYWDDIYLIFPVFADLDNDGDEDIMFGSNSEYLGEIYYYENKGIKLNIIENEQLSTTIFPNPATDILQLTNIETIDKVEIFNALGQPVQLFNKPQQGISLKDLPPGTYMVKITSDSGAQGIKKLLKQ